MKTNEYVVLELSKAEADQTNGGGFFLFALIAIVAAEAIIPAIVILPLAAAAYKGYNDYQPSPAQK